MATGKLSAKKVEAAKAGRHGDGGGLWLAVSPSGTRSFVYRFTLNGKTSEMGLGPFPLVSLADARVKAAEVRAIHKSGRNPLHARRQQDDQPPVPTFGQVAEELIKAKSSEWRNEKHRAQWAMTLRVYCKPISKLPIDEVTTEHVLSILKPVWGRAPETASRLRGRVEAVLDAAKAKGYRTGENPAAWRGHLSHLLPKRQKLTRGHHAAMPFDEVADFVSQLRERGGMAAKALEFTILTAARSGEVLGAQWGEVDLAEKLWTVPATRMKGGKIHRVPLNDRAAAILAELGEEKVSEWVFPGTRKNRPLSNMCMEMVLRRMGKAEAATVHGFRSSFRDFLAERTSTPRDIAELCLAHNVGSDVERAYRRSDILDKRRDVMATWGQFIEATTDSKVVSITKKHPSR